LAISKWNFVLNRFLHCTIHEVTNFLYFPNIFVSPNKFYNYFA
jgi:hypothetical protein